MKKLAPFAILSLLLVLPVAAQDEDWHDLRRKCEAAFSPLPVKSMFGDPMKELKISRRAPYTDAARAEIKQDRAKARLRRAQIADERKQREDLVREVGAAADPRAAQLLMEIYEGQLAEIDRARANLDRHEEAARIDINPGVDPGGVYWDRWLSKELGAARSILADETRIRDLALEDCVKRMSPEVRAWLVENAAEGDRVEVREQMVTALAKTGDPLDGVALGKILAAETKVWARVMILDRVAKEKTPGTAPLVLGALADETWPVRSAATAAARALELRDRAAIDALLGGLELSEGRVRSEIRDALVAATGQPFGLDPLEWKLWWGVQGEGWEPPEAILPVAPPDAPLPVLFGVPTASHRIAILISRGSSMLSAVKKRALGNDGEPSPEPAVESALAVAVWELEEALASLPPEAEFVVIVYGARPNPASKGLVRATKSARKKAVGLASRFAPEGPANVTASLEAVLRLGIPKKTEDLALAGEGDVDTIFIIGSGAPGSRSGVESPRARLRRLRRVAIHHVDLAKLPALAGEEK